MSKSVFTDKKELNRIENMSDCIEKICTFVENNSKSSSAKSLKKICINLYSASSNINLRRDIHNFDGIRMAWALYVLTYFFAHGEDSHIVELGERLNSF
jgi:hypothetical protein